MTLTIDTLNPESRPRPSQTAVEKKSLIGLTREELAAELAAIGVPERQIGMRVRQLWHWLYVRGISSFAQMSNVSKDLRTKLEEHYSITRPEIVEELIST